MVRSSVYPPFPPSSHFTPISLDHAFNADRSHLTGSLQSRSDESLDSKTTATFGAQTYRGIPFTLGERNEPNLVLLDPATGEVQVAIDPIQATYLVVLHAVEDHPAPDLFGFGQVQTLPGSGRADGNALGNLVAEYVLHYDDGSEATTPIRRRFAIQQRNISWGASAFEAVPALAPSVYSTATEDFYLNRVPSMSWGESECRHDSGRAYDKELLWLYALPNPHPAKPISGISFRPRHERAVVYGISATTLTDHPLRPGARQKLRLTLPDGVLLNALGELDIDHRTPAIGLDLGTVISARAALDYDETAWRGVAPDVQPAVSTQHVIVEYAAHLEAMLYVVTDSGGVVSTGLPGSAHATNDAIPIETITPANLPVHLRVIDRTTRQPVAVRLHLHGEHGEYLPPHGHHRKVNSYWFEDNYAEFVNDANQYSYISGECVVDLPIGRVSVEITRGYEIAPIRTVVEVTTETTTLEFELERRLPWRERGWVTADTHVHFLSPQTALLEGAAEGVNVVNLLASQWGEMFSNVGDFDGRTTLGARDFGGDGEFLVRVGTENRMHVLGHISLLGYSGAMIGPLCTGGPAESAIGDPQEVSMAEWAVRCIDQNGLVVMPHGPNPQCERAADIVLDLVHAMEMMTFNPYAAQLGAYGLADWYRYLNIGHQVPLCGGSDKMSASSLLGGVRTYAHLGEHAFTFGSWMDAVRSGNTFVTVGPLIEFAVEGKPAGQKINLSATGGSVDVTWTVESVSVPIEQVEVIVGGLVVEQQNGGGALSVSGSASVRVTDSTWIALRVRGSLRGRPGDIAAHTSAVQLLVGDRPIFRQPDAVAVLEQIEGALAYVGTIATRPEASRYRQLRASIEAAHNRLHTRMHQQGIGHLHSPVQEHHES